MCARFDVYDAVITSLEQLPQVLDAFMDRKAEAAG